MTRLILITALAVLATSSLAAGADCERARQYSALADQMLAKDDKERALDLLHRSIDSCPNYDAYEALAEVNSQSPERTAQEQAASAFVEAEALAPSKDKHAHTLYEYAQLLDAAHEPQNAFPLLTQARTLDPQNADIQRLTERVGQEVQNPNKADLLRVLRYPLARPLRSHGPAVGGESSGTPEASAARGRGGIPIIPVHFYTGSVTVDSQTQANVTVLAHTLADPSLQNQQFKLIGHADKRGGDDYNVALSLRRAQAISELVIVLEPSLAGRIEVEGHGAREPIDPGNDEHAWWANRRLEVDLR